MTSLVTTQPPVRADLINVQPIYYPVVETHRYGSVRALCRRQGWPIESVQAFIDQARLERSSTVVMPDMTIGSDDENCAVLVMQSGGAVILCAGLFAEQSDDRAKVEHLLTELAVVEKFKGRLLAVGEFRARSRGAVQ